MYICVMSMFNGLYLALELKCTQRRIENAHLLSSCLTTTHTSLISNILVVFNLIECSVGYSVLSHFTFLT